MLLRFSLFVVLLLSGSLTDVSAQIRLSGRVVDAVSCESLPGASLHIEGTYTGTITNNLGQFELIVPDESVAIVVRYIGYKSARVGLSSDISEALLIRLERTTIDLPEITITGEDPAIGIMRRVIEEKHKWRAELQTYVVNAYNRFRMENDTGIVSIWESSTRAFWDRERGVREVSLWQQRTKNSEFDDVMPAALFVLNLYDDDVEVAGHRLMGVTHPNALKHYRFKLESIQARDEKEVYIIDVAPRSRTAAGFVGKLSVLDGDYALLSADLRPGESFLFPPPIQEIAVHYRQQFSPFGGSTWLPIDLQTEMDVKVGLAGILEFPTFRIRQLSRLSDFEINVPLPDSLYESDDMIVVDSSIVAIETRPPELVGVPLTVEEELAYATIDSSFTVEKAFKPTGALSRFVDVEDDNGDGSSSGGGVSRSMSKLNLNLAPDLWYNRVEGLHSGVRASLRPVSWLRFLGMYGYESARKASSYGGGIRVGNRRSITVQWADETVTRYESQTKSRFLNSADVMIGETDYFDYHRRRGFEGILRIRDVFDSGVEANLTYVAEEHTSLKQNLTSSLLGVDIPTDINLPVEEGTLQYARLKLRREYDWIPVPVGPQKAFELEIEKGLGGEIADGGDYLRAQGSAFWRFNTFFGRRLLPNVLELRVVAGAAAGTVPVQKMGIVDGASMLTNFGSIKTLENAPYEGDRWALLAWEHSFRTVPFEWMDWDWPIRKHWNVIVTGAHGWSDVQDYDLSEGPVYVSDGIHHEVGLSLSGIFTVLRIDSSWRLDQPGFRFGFSMARIF